MTTVLTEAEVLATAKDGLSWRAAEKSRLERIFLYLRDPDPNFVDRSTLASGPLRWLARDIPPSVRQLAELSRVNMVGFVVDATVQVMYVDGFRAPTADAEDPAWETWQQNRMDARQIGVHRSALSYGASYVTILPGDPVAKLRGASPRKMTCVYGDDEDWPEYALELRRHPKQSHQLYRLYDSENVWWIEIDEKGNPSLAQAPLQHGAGVTPVVRFLSTFDDDGVVSGEVEPLIPLQDQINVTTFGLQVAQHYGAFRQRYIMGWAADSEQTALTAGAKKLWTFEDPEVQVGEFAQTDLSGYIASRESSLRHLATISQTPAHELLGQLVNLSADALAAAERNHRAKVNERQTSFGESWEQVLSLAAKIDGNTSDPAAEVRWRDTEARSLSSVADALGKLVVGLGVPPQELWDRIPGVTRTEIERWKSAAQQGDAIQQLTDILERQTGGQMGAAKTEAKNQAAGMPAMSTDTKGPVHA